MQVDKTFKNLKKDFPIFNTYKNLVYLDSAATTQKPASVIDNVVKHYTQHNANVHRGIYKLSELATQAYENTRLIVKEFINAKSEKEIIFTYGTTDAINFLAYWWRNPNSLGNYILTTQMEHHSNFIPWQQRVKFKEQNPLILVNVKNNYKLDLEDLSRKLEKYKPRLLTLTHISNVLGTINPIKKIVEIRNKISPNTRILIDAAQSIGHLNIDVQDLGIDMLVFSGHKMYGPGGTGIIWAKQDILENEMAGIMRYGGGMIQDVEIEDSTWADIPERFEGGTPNIEGVVGLAAAIQFIQLIGMDNIVAHETKLTSYALQKLSELSFVKILGPQTIQNRIGIFSISINGIHPHDIAQILDQDNICVRAGHHCCQILMKKVLKLPATARISLGVYNTKEDIDQLVKGLIRANSIFS